MVTINDLQNIIPKIRNNYSCGKFLDDLYQQDPGCFYYKFIYELLSIIKPTLSIELGVCTGRGTAHLAGGYISGKVIGIDPAPYDIQYIINIYPNISIMKGRSDDQNIISRIDNNSVDICFIDSEHSGNYTIREVNLWRPKMKPGGVYLFDDIDLNPSMKAFWNNLRMTKTELNDLHIGYGRDVGFGAAIC